MESRRTPHGNKGKPKTGGKVLGSANKTLNAVKSLAQSYGVDAIDTLADLMLSDRQPGPVRVAAARELLDRGFGRPTQFIAGDDAAPPIRFGTKVDWDAVPLEALKHILAAASSDPVGSHAPDDEQHASGS